jgi:hypothetical protein
MIERGRAFLYLEISLYAAAESASAIARMAGVPAKTGRYKPAGMTPPRFNDFLYCLVPLYNLLYYYQQS